jgi:hypothetical protein
MTDIQNYIMKKILVLVFSLLVGSCAIQQYSSVQRISKIEVGAENSAILAISANYKMNMSSSNDVIFYLKETTTGKIIKPGGRDNNNNNMYFSVPPGIYKIAMITITEPVISKTILFNDSTKKVVKMLGKINANQIIGPAHPGTGISFSKVFIIPTGDKKLIYDDVFSDTVRIKANCAYYLGEFKFEGYIEGVFNDMPNIKISSIKPVSESKLESFRTIFKTAYPNSEENVDTTLSLFRTNYIDLSKTNAIK